VPEGSIVSALPIASDAPVEKMTAKTVLERLQRHYIKPGDLPGGVFVPECGINGSGGQSRADALYVGFTSTSGRLLIGHEIKVSRADWRKELDSAGKADFWADNSHAWYIVAPGPEIVPKEELPDGWGLMYPNPRTKTRMNVVVKATVHRDRIPSWDAVRSIMARVDTLRAQHDVKVKQAALEDARKRVIEEQARVAPTKLTPEQRGRLTTLDRLEDLLGAKVVGWIRDGEADQVDVATAAATLRLVRAVQDTGVDRVRGYSVTELQAAGAKLLDGLAAFEAARIELAALVESR
jgi:hypothetical protein